ncbi:MAG: type I 3-dehydroquinate dehydratase [Bacteroidales bacterium]|nr:type I 3-dehydroquinate dehydratase [Bacteroidales bacterium]
MICISLGNMSFKECKELVRKEEFVELRLDLLKLAPIQVKELVELPGKKIITCRQGDYTDNERLELFSKAIASGVDYLDLELEMPDEMRQTIITRARSSDCQIIISYHDYSGTPARESLQDLIHACKEAGADIVKLACQVNEPSDNIRLLSLYDANERLVIIGMGRLGTITRIAGPLLGGIFTFAAPGQEMETAAGQLTKESLQQVYDLIGANI